jgi:hypothetical protein
MGDAVHAGGPRAASVRVSDGAATFASRKEVAPRQVRHLTDRDRATATGRCISHCDDDLAAGISLVEVADGRRGLAQRIRAIDGRRDLPCFEKLAES